MLWPSRTHQHHSDATPRAWRGFDQRLGGSLSIPCRRHSKFRCLPARVGLSPNDAAVNSSFNLIAMVESLCTEGRNAKICLSIDCFSSPLPYQTRAWPYKSPTRASTFRAFLPHASESQDADVPRPQITCAFGRYISLASPCLDLRHGSPSSNLPCISTRAHFVLVEQSVSPDSSCTQAIAAIKPRG